MADVHIITTRTPGELLGIQLHILGLQSLNVGVNGEALRDILLEAAQPMLEDLKQEWYEHWFDYDTGASVDSIVLETTEVGDKHARIILQAGGEKLIQDSRNTRHMDYAPYLEFHEGGGMFRHAVSAGRDEFVERVRVGLQTLIQELTQ